MPDEPVPLPQGLSCGPDFGLEYASCRVTAIRIVLFPSILNTEGRLTDSNRTAAGLGDERSKSLDRGLAESA